MKKRFLILFLLVALVASAVIQAASAQDTPPTPDMVIYTEAQLQDDVTAILEEPPSDIPIDTLWVTIRPTGDWYEGHQVFELGWPISCNPDNRECFQWIINTYCVDPLLPAPVKGDLYIWDGVLKLTYVGPLGTKQSQKFLNVIRRPPPPANVSFTGYTGCTQCVDITVSELQNSAWVIIYTTGQTTGLLNFTLQIKEGNLLLVVATYCDGQVWQQQVVATTGLVVQTPAQYAVCLPIVSKSPPPQGCPTDILEKVKIETDEWWTTFTAVGSTIGSPANPKLVGGVGYKATISYRQGTIANNILTTIGPNGKTFLCLNGTCGSNLGAGPYYEFWGGIDLIGLNVYDVRSSFTAPDGSICKVTVWLKDPPQLVQDMMAAAPSPEVANAIFEAYAEQYYAGASEEISIAAAQAANK